MLHPIGRFVLFLVPLLLVVSNGWGKTVHSMDDGPWRMIDWDGGTPREGDTVVVHTTVIAPEVAPRVYVIIPERGLLVVPTGEQHLTGLIVDGRLELQSRTLILVQGPIVNTGVISGEGTIGLSGVAARLRATRPVGHLLITGEGSEAAVIEGSCVCSTLVIDAGRRLSVIDGDITVMGSYVDRNGPFGDGITCNGGVARLRGNVSGSVRGGVFLEEGSSSSSGRPVTIRITGRLGDSAHGVVLTADRTALGSIFSGTLVVDVDATLTGSGIAGGGTNLVEGSAIILGQLRSSEPGGRWVIDSSLVVFGSINSTTLRFARSTAALDASTGEWGRDVSVEYVSTSNGVLTMIGGPVLSRLTIAGITTADTCVVVHAIDGSLRIRHEFRSDLRRGCRLVCDSVVELFGHVSGIVESDIVVVGFWGSEISGRIGRPGSSVRFISPKRLMGDAHLMGEVDLASWSRIDVVGWCTVPDSCRLGGRVMLHQGGALLGGRVIELMRGAEGGGDIRVTGDMRLYPGEGLIDSVGIVIDSSGLLLLDAPLIVPRMSIQLGGELDYGIGDTITVTRSFVREVDYHEGVSLASAAVDPVDVSPASVFAGSTPPVYAFDGEHVPATWIVPGEGYYVKYDTAAIVAMEGRFVNLPLTVPVRSGWNLVGGGSIPANVADVSVDGTTIETPFYASSAGSGQVTAILPGRGYWVRVSTDGAITLHPAP